jgi:hypothetical protein
MSSKHPTPTAELEIIDILRSFSLQMYGKSPLERVAEMEERVGSERDLNLTKTAS